MTQKTDNIWISLMIKIYTFIVSGARSIFGLISGRKNLQSDTFDDIDFFVRKFPTSWARHPTGIGIGRSFIVGILYFFQKHAYFHKDK